MKSKKSKISTPKKRNTIPSARTKDQYVMWQKQSPTEGRLTRLE